MTFSKRFKSLIALALSIAVIFGLSVPFASFASDDDSARDAKAAYDFLMAVGAMDASEAIFDADMPITRAHFVKLALHLSNDAPNVLVSNDEVFYDVTPSTEYENYIETAYRIGYISGSASGMFEPDQTITLLQALKILCNVLGYEQLAEVYGGFPNGYLVVAQRIELLDGVAADSNSSLNMADAMLFLENAAKTEVMQIVSIGDNIDMKTVDGETLLYKNHGIDYIEGTINANSYTNLLSQDSSLGKNQVSVSGVTFNAKSNEIQDYLGLNVRLYFDAKSSSAIKTAVYAEMTESNKIIDAVSKDLDIDGDRIICYDDEDNTKSIKVSSTVSYILNGKMTFMDFEDLLSVEKGSITFVSNDDDNVIDVVKVTKYDTLIVSGVSASSGIIVATDGSRIYLDPEDENYSFTLSKNGAAADISAIAAEDVILVSEGFGAGYRHIDILASSKAISAAFEEVGDDYAIVSGTRYSLDAAIKGSIKMGNTYKILFDAFGSICHIKTENDIVYGFLYALGKQGMDKPQCRIFTENGRWVDLYFADKVKYNGSTVSAQNLYDTLTADGDSYKKLVRYNVNSTPELIKLETYTEIPISSNEEKQAIENDTFRMSYSGTLRYRNSPKSFNGVFFVDPNAKIFNIPQDLSKDKFKVRDISALKTDTQYNVTAFNVDKYLTSGILVTSDLASDTELSNTDKFMIVDSLGQILNADGDVVPSVKGYWDEVEISFPVKVGEGGVAVEVLNSLSKGDIILFKYDEDSNIIAITRYPSEDTYYTSTSTLYTTFAVIGGVVSEVDITGKKIRMTYSESGSELGVIYTDTTTAAIWDKNTKTYRAADVSEIIPGDEIFINTRYLNCHDVIIMRQ